MNRLRSPQPASKMRAVFRYFVLLLLAQNSPGQTQNAAKVISVQGVVERQQPPWIPFAANTWLPFGATIRTGDQSRAVLLMLDETQLKLNSNTELQLIGVRDASNTVLRRVATAASRSQESVLGIGNFWRSTDSAITQPAPHTFPCSRRAEHVA
jgi:hypothetical protein